MRTDRPFAALAKLNSQPQRPADEMGRKLTFVARWSNVGKFLKPNIELGSTNCR